MSDEESECYCSVPVDDDLVVVDEPRVRDRTEREFFLKSSIEIGDHQLEQERVKAHRVVKEAVAFYAPEFKTVRAPAGKGGTLDVIAMDLKSGLTVEDVLALLRTGRTWSMHGVFRMQPVAKYGWIDRDLYERLRRMTRDVHSERWVHFATDRCALANLDC